MITTRTTEPVKISAKHADTFNTDSILTVRIIFLFPFLWDQHDLVTLKIEYHLTGSEVGGGGGSGGGGGGGGGGGAYAVS